MKIGIFGGCFNPPHNRHKQIALELIKKRYVDRVIFVPTDISYQKNNLIDNEKRYHMLKLMIESEENLELSDYEFRVPSKTYQTLDYFRNRYWEDTLYFLCGSDNLKRFSTWERYDYILKNYFLLVIPRDSDEVKQIKEKYSNQDHIIIASLSHDCLSSTLIRKKIKAGDFAFLSKNLDRRVLEYIMKTRLYEK